MKIGVCIKSVPDTTAKIQVREDGQGIVEQGIKYGISPYDEYAIEQALTLKESLDQEVEVVVLSFGGVKAQDTLRSALAMGADRAIFVQDPNQANIDALVTSKVLHKVIEKEGFELVLTGKQAIDGDNGQVSQMVAHRLDWPYVTVASAFTYKEDQIEVMREIDQGAKEKWTLTKPCLIACTKGEKDPRYASLKGIMAAKKKPLEELSLESLSIDQAEPQVSIENFEVPTQERKKQVFEDATPENIQKLVELLREEAKVI